MEEQRKDETKETQEKKKLWETLPVRSCILMCLAGIYLPYTGYRLCKNVLAGVEGASIGFMLVGIAFLVVGAGMLYIGIRGVLWDNKLQKEEAAKESEKAEALPEETKETEREELLKEKKTMSIKDRANLTERIAEETEEE